MNASSSADPGAATLQLQLPGHVDALEPARLAMLQHLSAAAVDRQAVYRCELVLEEVFLNIVRHAAAETGVELGVTVTGDQVRLRFVDAGPGFDPTALPAPAMPMRLEDARPGGLGIHLVRRLTRSLAYRREEGRNLLEARVDRTRVPCGEP